MMDVDKLPKSVKKAVRYIKQDAPDEKLLQIKKVIDKAFDYRERQSEKN
ncbi:hypothetical protein [Virgibacillus sediminis]|uniref:Uncharacterized protein n=1 Tax=Virgibacillus sediminis TaxID=202260 RepID=A0ABV7A472_9BACI